MQEVKIWQEPLVIAEVLFKAVPSFKEWIEGTSLFKALKEESAVAGTLRVHEPDGSITTYNLNGKTIDKAEDLPIEIIGQFYINSPFKKDKNEY